jgi:hypothetical protein
MGSVYHSAVLQRNFLDKGVHNMPSKLELGVSAMFRDAVKQSIVIELRTQGDWDRFKAIDEGARQQTRDEVDSFERDRPARLAAARKKIIDKAGEKNFEHPAPFGTDKFDKAAIERQAVTKIFNEHYSALMKIKGEETKSYDSLRDDIHAREGVRDVAREAFGRSTDRRGTPDRLR